MEKMFKEIQNTMVDLEKKQASALSSSSSSMKTSILKSFKYLICFNKPVNYYCWCPNYECLINCWTCLTRLDKSPSCRVPFKITCPSCDGVVSTKLKPQFIPGLAASLGQSEVAKKEVQ